MIKKREGELSKNSYRNQVVGRLKGISKTIFDMSIPIAIDVSLEKVCKIIQKKLPNGKFKNYELFSSTR